jgi:hypothetical protein
VISTSIDSSKPWIAKEHDRPASVEIRLLKRSLVLPWSQFFYAEGSNDEIRLSFATHEVLVKGAGLGALLEDLSGQRVSLLREPVRADRFVTEPGPRITSISVGKVE